MCSACAKKLFIFTVSLKFKSTMNSLTASSYHVDVIIQGYFLSGMHYDEILAFLYLRHNVQMSLSTLKRKLRTMKLYKKMHFSDFSIVIDFIQAQLRTSGQLCGYRWIHQRCIQNGLVVTQNTVRIMLQELDPEGVEYRKRKRLRRRKYVSKGPNYVWHLDAYDKLKPYGIAISGCIDGFTRRIIWLRAGRTASDPKVIGGYFIDAVKKIGGCLRRVRFDCCTENVLVEKLQQTFRETAVDNSDTMFGEKSFIYGTSQNNQRIEAWWSILRKHTAQFWMNLFQELKENDQFSGSELDKSLMQFCFLRIIQEDLEQTVYEWNTHNITASRNAVSPRGRPAIMYELPELYNTVDYVCDIDHHLVEACESQCVFHKLPCKADIYELCTIVRNEKNILAPEDPYSAADLYIQLRAALKLECDID